MLTRGRSRWGTVIPEAGLDAYMASVWAFFVSVPLVGLVDAFIVVLSGWSTESLGVPYEVSVSVATFLAVVASFSLYVMYRRVKRVAGRALGLSARDSRRLDVFSPEVLSASLARVRGEQRQG
jgi:hypothetical protein